MVPGVVDHLEAQRKSDASKDQCIFRGNFLVYRSIRTPGHGHEDRLKKLAL
jgi:hypothetical protein